MDIFDKLKLFQRYSIYGGRDGLIDIEMDDGGEWIKFEGLENLINEIQSETEKETHTGVLTSPQGWNYSYVYTLKD